jgi:nitroreductase
VPTIPAFKTAFGVPEEYTPIGALTVGYRAADKRSPSLRRGHRPVDDVVHHGRWAG